MDVGNMSHCVFVYTHGDVLGCTWAEFEEVLYDICKTVGHVNSFSSGEGLVLAIVAVLLVAPSELDSTNV
jgi:hypothetical protein